ncbi:helix-turn-helix transcriptional regulator [Dechloromonas denitrificans]|uniref:helix-turn-helix transcriptional regulator n=1 Tax=Dechloromonas denitrificans TaxID=281362 RepID=UPI001CF80BCB|nr:AlpA family phage regulatory protein [Dechloromonas denitrificans]UCV04980.1 AlpA family phage regulatory protein [Dechloromonas denitrificans]
MTIQSKVVGTSEIYRCMCNISRATFYRVVMVDPTFPKPFKIGLRKNAWLRADIVAWIDSLAARVAA